MNLIYLIGMPGSGKTTLGKLLANVLELDFHDMDYMIELFEGKKIPQIFEDHGETYFREVEKKVLNDTTVFDNAVISTGGGVPCFFDNMDVIQKIGTSIYLKVTPEELFKRVSQMDGRPLLEGKQDEALLKEITAKLEKRAVDYEKSPLIVEGDNLSVDDVLAKLKSIPWINDRLPK